MQIDEKPRLHQDWNRRWPAAENQVALHFCTTVIPAEEEQVGHGESWVFTICFLIEPRDGICKAWLKVTLQIESPLLIKKKKTSPLTIPWNSGTAPAHHQPASSRGSLTYPAARCDRLALRWATAVSWLVAMGTISRGGKAQAARDSLGRKDGRQRWSTKTAAKTEWQLKRLEFESLTMVAFESKLPNLNLWLSNPLNSS